MHRGYEVLWQAIFMFLFLFSCTSSPKNESAHEKEDPVADDRSTRDNTKVHIVEIKQMKFEPGEVKVRKGDQVRWVNKDITNHDVTEQSRRAWASSPLATGQSWSMTATESVDYYCNLHQVMKGRIIVE